MRPDLSVRDRFMSTSSDGTVVPGFLRGACTRAVTGASLSPSRGAVHDGMRLRARTELSATDSGSMCTFHEIPVYQPTADAVKFSNRGYDFRDGLGSRGTFSKPFHRG